MLLWMNLEKIGGWWAELWAEVVKRSLDWQPFLKSGCQLRLWLIQIIVLEVAINANKNLGASIIIDVLWCVGVANIAGYCIGIVFIKEVFNFRF